MEFVQVSYISKEIQVTKEYDKDPLEKYSNIHAWEIP